MARLVRCRTVTQDRGDAVVFLVSNVSFQLPVDSVPQLRFRDLVARLEQGEDDVTVLV